MGLCLWLIRLRGGCRCHSGGGVRDLLGGAGSRGERRITLNSGSAKSLVQEGDLVVLLTYKASLGLVAMASSIPVHLNS